MAAPRSRGTRGGMGRLTQLKARAGILKGIAEGLIDPRSLLYWSYDLNKDARTVERYGISSTGKTTLVGSRGESITTAPTTPTEAAKPEKEYIRIFKTYVANSHVSGEFTTVKKHFWDEVKAIKDRKGFDLIFEKYPSVFRLFAAHESPYVRGESGTLKASLIQERLESLGFSREECQKSKSWYPLFYQPSDPTPPPPQFEGLVDFLLPDGVAGRPIADAPAQKAPVGSNSEVHPPQETAKSKKKKKKSSTSPAPDSNQSTSEAAGTASPEIPKTKSVASGAAVKASSEAETKTKESEPNEKPPLPPIIAKMQAEGAKAKAPRPDPKTSKARIIEDFEKSCKAIAERGTSGVKVRDRKALIEYLLQTIKETDTLDKIQEEVEQKVYYGYDEIEELADRHLEILSQWMRPEEAKNNRIAKWHGPLSEALQDRVRFLTGKWDENEVHQIRVVIDQTLIIVDEMIEKEYESRKQAWLAGDSKQLPYLRDEEDMIDTSAGMPYSTGGLLPPQGLDSGFKEGDDHPDSYKPRRFILNQPKGVNQYFVNSGAIQGNKH